jgi:WhiB family redox-sensing transcriptional regulator
MMRLVDTVTLPPLVPESWIERATCRTDSDPDAWHPDAGETRGPRAQHAQQVCWDCPVRKECLAGALARNEPYGIWGGYTRAQRNRLVREIRARRAARTGAAA